jgi:hypothetical protein
VEEDSKKMGAQARCREKRQPNWSNGRLLVIAVPEAGHFGEDWFQLDVKAEGVTGDGRSSSWEAFAAQMFDVHAVYAQAGPDGWCHAPKMYRTFVLHVDLKL